MFNDGYLVVAEGAAREGNMLQAQKITEHLADFRC